jgi:hypothetical protein
MLKVASVLFFMLAPISAFATGGLYCKSAGIDIDFTTARMEGSPIISPIKIQLAGNSFSVPQKCVNGYWNLGTRVWLSVNPTADCGMEEPAPSFQLKVRDNGKSIQGKVFINHMGTKSTQNISCDLG